MKKILIFAGAVTVGLTIILMVSSGRRTDSVTTLARPALGESDTTYQLTYEADGKTADIEIPVSAKTISSEELQSYFDKAYEQILKEMPGDNESLDNVQSDLNFIETIDQYNMTADYTLDDYSVIDCNGKLSNEEVADGGENFTVYCRLSYEEYSQEYEIPVTVYPPQEKAASFSDKILDSLTEGEEEVMLPETVDGKKITFYEKKDNYVPLIFLAIIAAGLVWYYKKYTLPKRERERREKQMMLDYSEIVSKISLLMGAGMSSGRAFKKIATDYQRSCSTRKNGTRYAYEEILQASNRMDNGTPEAEAYALFGRSCHLHQYIKLGNLLAQNVQKGSAGFNETLQNEVTESFALRKAMAKKTGEEAGTKLLGPMLMQLIIVFAVIMIPAFMSF